MECPDWSDTTYHDKDHSSGGSAVAEAGSAKHAGTTCAEGGTVAALNEAVTGKEVVGSQVVSNIVLGKTGYNESVCMTAEGCTVGTQIAETELTPSAELAGQSCGTEAPAWG